MTFNFFLHINKNYFRCRGIQFTKMEIKMPWKTLYCQFSFKTWKLHTVYIYSILWACAPKNITLIYEGNIAWNVNLSHWNHLNSFSTSILPRDSISRKEKNENILTINIYYTDDGAIYIRYLFKSHAHICFYDRQFHSIISLPKQRKQKLMRRRKWEKLMLRVKWTKRNVKISINCYFAVKGKGNSKGKQKMLLS